MRSWVRTMAVLWTLLIATSCLLPSAVFNTYSWSSLLAVDKVAHVVLYAIFILLWGLSIKRVKGEMKTRIILFFTAILFGVIIEFIQSAMSVGRSFEVDDMIANAIGCAIGMGLIPFVRTNALLIKKYLPFQKKGNY